MKRRDRILKAFNFEETESVPMDLGGMRSSGVSCFQYSDLRKHLGLKEGLPLVFDDFQMLALPECDVLDALDCDVVFTNGIVCNAFDERDKFRYYDFDGRLPAMVDDPGKFEVQPDGTISRLGLSMPPSSYVFDAPHGGHAFDIDNLYRQDLGELRREMEESMLSDKELEDLAEHCEKTRGATDRAIFLNSYQINLNFVGGIANGSMLCLLDPGHIREVHDIKAEYKARNMERIISAVKANVDLVLAGNQDLGTQNTTIVHPDLIAELWMPYFKRVNDAAHGAWGDVKTFLHSCGAIYDILDNIIESGFDIVNPVQWAAGKQSYKEWKDKGRNRIVFWGGGTDSQHMMPLGTLEEIRKQVREVVSYMKKDGGYVFSNTHNLTAEIVPEKISAIYDEASKVR